MRSTDDDENGENSRAISLDHKMNSVASTFAMTATTTTTPGDNSSGKQQERSHCLVCYSDLRGGSGNTNNNSKQVVAAGITPCHHDDICGLCHLRLRQLHSDTKCPICKADNEVVIVDYVNHHKTNSNSSGTKKQFEDYPVWGENLGQDFIFDRGMFFPVAYYHSTVKPLSSYQCTVKECGFATAATKVDANAGSNGTQSLRTLQDHLHVQHRLELCQLCVDNKRDFVARLPRYSPSGLQKHMTGHPVCEMCHPQRFYDGTALHSHLNKEHYTCHVCEIAGSPNQFFKNYSSLELHFERKHFLCHDPQCLQARFVVFANELNLRNHVRQAHGGNSGTVSSSLSSAAAPGAADFHYGLDETAFVSAALPSSSSTQDSVLLHSQHVARHSQELRQQAADDDFPTLQATVAASKQQQQQQARNNYSSSNSGNRLTIGWSSFGALNHRVGHQKPAGALTEEDFPSLMAPASKK